MNGESRNLKPNILAVQEAFTATFWSTPDLKGNLTTQGSPAKGTLSYAWVQQTERVQQKSAGGPTAWPERNRHEWHHMRARSHASLFPSALHAWSKKLFSVRTRVSCNLRYCSRFLLYALPSMSSLTPNSLLKAKPLKMSHALVTCVLKIYQCCQQRKLGLPASLRCV